MSLFEYDQGHLIPAQFGHPVGPEAQGEVLDSVRRQVLEVISRPLFPVTWNDMTAVPGMPEAGTNQESPRLTALDGSGQVVLVEVMETLDSQTLIEALARLGAVSNLGWNDLAAAYPGGVGAFRSGWTQFRDAMPPNLVAGPRLVIVATQIDPGVRPALDALTSSGLEVHHVSVREMSNGRRFLDVQRVAVSLFSHDTNLLAGRGARMPALTSSVQEDFTTVSPSASVDVPLEESAQTSPAASPEVPPAGGEEPAPVDEPMLQTGSISRRSIMEAAKGSPVSPAAADEDDEPVRSLFTTQHGTGTESEVPDFRDVVYGNPDTPENTAHHMHRAPVSEEFGQPTEAAAETPTETPVETPAEDSQDFVEIEGLLSHDAAGLSAIAQVTGEDTPLFGYADTEGGPTQIQATLLERGAIILEGSEFGDPDAAAQAVLQGADGWNFWRLGIPEGPTLAEAAEEINAEILRENKK